MNIFLGVIVGIIVLTLIVTIHEFGHFMAAKKAGVKVNEFGIGFPPKAVTWLHIPARKAEEYCDKFKFKKEKTNKILKKAERRSGKYIWIPLPKSEWYEETKDGLSIKKQDYLIFSINYLPIGGFCQMDGESDADTRKGSFGAATFWQKTKILFAGVTMNWLFAFVVLTILAWTGMPQFIDNQFFVSSDVQHNTYPVEIKSVIENSPADIAGLKTGYLISNAYYGNESVEISSTNDLIDFNNSHSGETVKYKAFVNSESYNIYKNAACDDNNIVESSDSCNTVSYYEVKLNLSSAEYLLGISMASSGQVLYHSTWSAPIVGAVQTVQLTGETFKGLGTMIYNLFSGVFEQFSGNEATRTEGQAKLKQAGDSVTGPVGIIGILFPAFTAAGLTNIAFLAAIISISLACMNVLPIPALDGGRWFLIALYRTRKKKLTTEIETRIVSRAMIVILLLAVVITVLDILKLVR